MSFDQLTATQTTFMHFFKNNSVKLQQHTSRLWFIKFTMFLTTRPSGVKDLKNNFINVGL